MVNNPDGFERLSMSSMRAHRNVLPPRVVLYGTAGIGKTSFAAEFPDPVFVQTEEGIPGGVEVQAFPAVQSFAQFEQAILALGTEPHDRKTLVIDTIDSLEPLIIAQVCAERGWNTEGIEEPGYGKGYVAYKDKFIQMLRMLNWLRKTRNMAVVILSHFEIHKFNEPGTEGYDRYGVRLHKNVAPLLVDEADVVGFLNYQTLLKETDAGFNKKHVHAVSHGTRMIHFEERAGYVAKNRYSMPASMPFEAGRGFEKIAPYLPGMDTPVTAVTDPNAPAEDSTPPAENTAEQPAQAA